MEKKGFEEDHLPSEEYKILNEGIVDYFENDFPQIPNTYVRRALKNKDSSWLQKIPTFSGKYRYDTTDELMSPENKQRIEKIDVLILKIKSTPLDEVLNVGFKIIDVCFGEENPRGLPWKNSMKNFTQI